MMNLEEASARPLPSADELADRWVRKTHPNPTPDDRRTEIMSKLRFGVDFSDHMARAMYTKDQGWHDFRIEPYAPILLDPAAAVFHYAQEVFEGLKAYRHADGSVWMFRPAYNGARLNYSGARMAIPPIDEDEFLASLVGLVRADEAWVPTTPGSSLYLRPFIIATEPFLGVRSSNVLEYFVIASPSGPYFEGGFTPISVWVSSDYHRAGPGGTGAAKCGGNYAASLVPKVEAHDAGYDEVCFLDAETNENIDELGGMNVFVIHKDGSVATPKLTGNILPGGTRGAILQLLEDWGVEAREETIKLSTLIEDIRSGEVTEMFACGTAAVVTSIGKIDGDGFSCELPTNDVTQKIYEALTSIQLGTAPDPHGWTYRIC